MSSTYAKIDQEANKQYLFDMYGIQREYSRRSVAAPWPINIPFIIIDIVGYFIRHETVKAIWKDSSSSERVDNYLRRNMPLECMERYKVRSVVARRQELHTWYLNVKHDVACARLTQSLQCLQKLIDLAKSIPGTLSQRSDKEF
jgi:hypothetical protein